ncbi:hypothetical protein Dde_2555 [Oleidesulfovibrio alaskensis G20]|jgi:hypothetical protein|uniref:Uncharacterized protein n=1 Tax=Oleidesulfovibrio alaskensis (strain ATCC BAA-1058 / DSM 17464 / G20) TaxID=207559 RepID=Q30Y95_OLEA2|nr:hypothetical protein [Oleidesulfovibrio alaskensis]ABB39351.1 hypothetical protein Dde_2555 [Oleidesulfovibrio alaskensis G20]MBG0773788.1 hypothetical protein [Oleidesulfovibrio alaskensis]
MERLTRKEYPAGEHAGQPEGGTAERSAAEAAGVWNGPCPSFICQAEADAQDDTEVQSAAADNGYFPLSVFLSDKPRLPSVLCQPVTAAGRGTAEEGCGAVSEGTGPARRFQRS